MSCLLLASLSALLSQANSLSKGLYVFWRKNSFPCFPCFPCLNGTCVGVLSVTVLPCVGRAWRTLREGGECGLPGLIYLIHQ